MIPYALPKHWILYDPQAILKELTEAKAAVLSLKEIPYLRKWVEELQAVRLKMEVAGTSRIEGADFTDKELEVALKETPDQLFTRSQKQAHAVTKAYRLITKIPNERPVTCNLICEIHRIIVKGADDDHCAPGEIRRRDENVNFGSPRHRGVQGGKDCEAAFIKLGEAVQREFRDHDPLLQALALHYHFGAMHPFMDGNGRTARVLEALMLQRAGLSDRLFIAMSNYYYDEKKAYLETLAQARAGEHDLTPFFRFGLRGVSLQCKRLFSAIKIEVSKSLFRNLMTELFAKLESARKRVIADRQMEILNLLLDSTELPLREVMKAVAHCYSDLSNPQKAALRDINGLLELGAIDVVKPDQNVGTFKLKICLDWPTNISEGTFLERVANMETSKMHHALAPSRPPVEQPELFKGASSSERLQHA